MKKILAAAAILAVSAISANAADLPARTYTKAPPMMADPIYNWSGFYFGGHAGYSDTDYRWNYTNPVPATIVPFGMNRDGGVYGGFVGAQYQWDRIVLGIEYSYNEHDRRNASNVGCGPNPTLAAVTCNVNARSTQTLGGKLGWAGWNNWLVYASGGYAQTRISTNVFVTATGTPFDFSARRTHDGAYAGVGFDYALWKGGFADVIVGAEYQHIWLDSRFHASSVDAFAVGGINGRNIRGDEDLIRAKLSVKFNAWGGPVVARY